MIKLANTILAVAAGPVLAGSAPISAVPEATSTGESPVAIRGQLDYWSPMKLDDGSGEYQLYAASFSSPIAGKAGERISWDLELNAEFIRFDINNDLNAYQGNIPNFRNLIDDRDLWNVGFTFNMMWNYENSNWSPFLRISPALATDFGGDTGSDDFRLMAIAGTFYQQSPTLKWIFAIAYQENFESAPILPFVGFDWQATETINVNLMGPRLNLIYAPADHWNVGLFTAANSRNWNIDTAAGSRNFEVNSARAGVSAAYKFGQKVWLTAETGISFVNSVDIQSTSGRTLYEEDADTGYFFNLGFRIPL